MRSGYLLVVTRSLSTWYRAGDAATLDNLEFDDPLDARSYARSLLALRHIVRIDIVALPTYDDPAPVILYSYYRGVPSYTRLAVTSARRYSVAGLRQRVVNIIFSDDAIEDAASRGVAWCRRIFYAWYRLPALQY